MRRNFPRPCTTTYLRFVIMGQLVTLADSEITAILQVVLTGFVTVSFHSVRVAVSFDAVSAHAQPVLSLQSASPSCHAPSILSLLTGIASARPSALVEGAVLETAAHPRPFKMSPPLWSDAVALIRSVGNSYILCRFAPSFPAFSFLVSWYCFLLLG